MADEEINQPPSLPPYTEMIFAAIDDLKEKEDSTESSISNYIESTCSSLPEDHTAILADQLNKLVEDGELVLLNNNYTRPEESVPVKRGRGRPPKPHTQTPAPALVETGSEVKRGRGRPRKDPNAPPSAKKVKVATEPTPPSKTGRPRRRPRKVQPELAGVEAN
ncbi:hypothetical protein L1987_74599 [Smallanthus sonchifolius]|uniref:Uncharacterized protein n=1 Tax=Smallanthus sonchifolius TaxID=185202 RepID=A0ACB9A4C0_9ASTR|nr:hypothetical protein L1987_74599 [Smallanthus sonchifolius]